MTPLTEITPGPRSGSTRATDLSGVPSRTHRHRTDKSKANGIHYTPPELADFLASEALRELGEAPERVLDPACGNGELLEAIWSALPRSAAQRTAFTGLDVDESAIEACNHRFTAFADSHFTFRRADFVQTAGPDTPPPSSWPSNELVPAGLFDLVIANPPYVRTQTLGGPRVAELVKQYGITGRIDLYMVFAFAMASVVRPGGVMALLCSNRFLTTRAGVSLRRMLRDQFSIGAVFDFGDTRLFGAAVLPAIVIATRATSHRPPRFVSIYRHVATREERSPTFTSVPALARASHTGTAEVDGVRLLVKRGVLKEQDPERPWTLQDEASIRLAARIAQAKALTIGSLTKIRVGIKTTADPVFIRDDWHMLPEDMRPEAELLHPLLTHHAARRWHADHPQRRVLYPHAASGDKTCAVDLANYPRTAAYLAPHRARLERRDYINKAGRAWYEIWVPQRAHLWAGPKVVFPDIAETPRFFVDVEGHLVNGDCYWAATSSLEEALLIAAVGNSKAAQAFYDAQCANQLYAGRRRFMTQYVERFPVPDPSSADAAAIINLAHQLFIRPRQSVEKELELDHLVSRSLGLEESLG